MSTTKASKQNTKIVSRYKSTAHYPTVDFSFKDIASLGASLSEIKPRGGKKVITNNSVNGNSKSNDGTRSNDVNNSENLNELEDEDSFSNSITLRKSLIERIPRHPNAQKDNKSHTMSFHSKSEQQQDEEEDEGPKKQRPKYYGTALKLSENQISSLNGLEEAINTIMNNPDEVSWLDLSFNMISTLEGIPKNLPLKSLYLHGNQIHDLKALLPLREFKELKSLTIHGCPVSEIKNYRFQVLAILPQLKNLDFSGVTKKDIETAKTFIQFFGNKI